MAGKALPQQRQQHLVAEDHLPGRLDPGRGVGQHVRAELLAHHPFPRVELEQHLDRHLVGIGEALAVPADLRHGERLAGEPGLDGGVAQVLRGELVLGLVLERAAKWTSLGGSRAQDAAPGVDQLLVDAVELVAVGLRRPSASTTGRRRPRAAPSACRRCTRAAWAGPCRRRRGRSGRRASGRCAATRVSM